MRTVGRYKNSLRHSCQTLLHRLSPHLPGNVDFVTALRNTDRNLTFGDNHSVLIRAEYLFGRDAISSRGS